MDRRSPCIAHLLLHLLALLHLASASDSLLDEALAAHAASALDRGSSASPAAAEVAARLHGRGFHRTLAFQLGACCPGCSTAQGATQHGEQQHLTHCEAALLQPLPAAVFANIYELDNAAAVGQGPPVRLFGPVDVESIERSSQPTLLAIYLNVTLHRGQVRQRYPLMERTNQATT